jgi:hypothetical protein
VTADQAPARRAILIAAIFWPDCLHSIAFAHGMTLMARIHESSGSD